MSNFIKAAAAAATVFAAPMANAQTTTYKSAALPQIPADMAAAVSCAANAVMQEERKLMPPMTAENITMIPATSVRTAPLSNGDWIASGEAVTQRGESYALSIKIEHGKVFYYATITGPNGVEEDALRGPNQFGRDTPMRRVPTETNDTIQLGRSIDAVNNMAKYNKCAL